MRKGHDQQLVDVICQHNKDGSMIPMRVRLTDEDGAVQTYTIKNYEDLSHQGTRTMPDGIRSVGSTKNGQQAATSITFCN